MNLNKIMGDVTEAIIDVDKSRVSFHSFKPDVGPYGEPQLLKLIVAYLNHLPEYDAALITKRPPDLLIPGKRALEFKIVRPFGDNGREAEDWSVNLLHSYAGSTSSIGDCLKLKKLSGIERKAVAV